MNKYLFLSIIGLTVLTIGCNKKNQSLEKIEVVEAEAIVDKDHIDTIIGSYLLNICRNDDIKIDYLYPNHILVDKNGFCDSIDLIKEGVFSKLNPSMIWMNKDYACIKTWHSQSLSRHIFIPVGDSKQRFVYLDKNIEYTDSLTNNVVYLDTVVSGAGKVIFRVENLKSRKNKTLEIALNEKNSVYPHYEEIELTRNKLQIMSTVGNISLNIGDIY